MGRIFQRLAAVMILAPATVCAAPILDFSGGFAGSSSSLNFNGTAQISGTKARITDGGFLQVGSVWSKNQVDIRKFSCQFTFQLPSSAESGFTFAIQRAGNTVSGYPYDFLGFTPMSPSFAVKFDFWPSGSMTGIYSNGEYPSDAAPASIDMAPSGIDLHSGHVFSVLLTYNGVTLQQTVTDTTTNAAFTHNYTVDLATTIGGIDAHVGFTGSTGGGSSSIQDILSWSYSITSSSYDVDFTAFPERLQLYPRNRATNTATVPVAGSELMGGFSQAVLRVYRNGAQVDSDQVQTLTYTNGKAPFSFTPAITAELAHYDIELLLHNSSNQLFSVLRAQDIVAGDVFVIQGQSNALAKQYSGSASAYTSPFIRTVGLESDFPSAGPSSTSWMPAIGDGDPNADSLSDIGQWGLVMGNQLMTSNSIPIAVINAAFGGQAISFFQRNDAIHDDVSTNYGRLLRRLQRAGVAGAVRTILFYQGESDKGNATQHETGFTALRSDWLQDYPSLEKLYVFQVREGCGTDVARFNVDLRNRQRLFADQFPNLTLMSTTGLDGHDGCHFYFSNGYESIGFNIARMLQRDLYNGSSLSNTDPPNPAYAVLTGANKNMIRIPLRNSTDAVTFDSGAIADFAVVGASVSIVSGGVVSGALELNLSGNATGATSVVYTGHSGPASGNWVKNANGIGLLSFSEPLSVDPTPTKIVSRKTHNAAGTFDVDLKPPASGIECRTGGATGDHTIVATFPVPVTVSGNGTVKAQVTSGTGEVGAGGIANGNAVTVSGAEVTVPLTNVANAQRLNITIFSVNDGTNSGDVVIPMGVLHGDVTANGGVNSSDVSATKAQSGAVTDANNFRDDVTVSGSVNSSDVSLVKSKSGTALP